MSIKKFLASKDTTITDAYNLNLNTRAVDANMGAADSLEVFSIFGQASSGSVEKSRILVEFDTTKISQARSNNLIPASGSVKFYLKLYNVEHPSTTPSEYTLTVHELTNSWEEGTGLDMEEYLDKGGNGKFGTTWNDRGSTLDWTTEGGDYDLSASYYIQYFETGFEDLSIDVTNSVEKWISGSSNNYGFLIRLSGNLEQVDTYGIEKSYYTKKFSSRTSEYTLKRPVIAAVWDDSKKDNRRNFKLYNPFKDSTHNRNNLYIYESKDLNNYPTLVSLYSSSDYSGVAFASASVGRVEKGIYSGSFSNVLSFTSSLTKVYDKWTSGSFTYLSGTINITTEPSIDSEYLLKITNLKPLYNIKENVKFRVFSRQKNWSPNIYTVVTQTIESTPLDDMYYRITRVKDGLVVLDYETGSVKYTKTSYDKDGNYFNLDMGLLESDQTYQISFATYNGEKLNELNDKFKFKVE
jgi:hypothetical protein